MATVESQIRNFHLGPAELKKLTGWPDVVIEFLLSMSENIVVASEGIDNNNDYLLIAPIPVNLSSEMAEIKKAQDGLKQGRLYADLSEIEERIARIEARINRIPETTEDIPTILPRHEPIAEEDLVPRPIPYQEKRFGDGLNYTEFEYDGTMAFHGDATVWRDDNIGAVSLGIGASPPDFIAVDGGTIQVRAFDGAAITEQLFGGTEYNHEAKESADIVFHVHWSPTTNNAGNVKWQLSYKWKNVDGSWAGAETTTSVTTAASGTAWDAQKVSFPAISGTGMEIGSQIALRFFRDPTDAADTYPDDAAITTTLGYHYEIDTGGSRQILTK